MAEPELVDQQIQSPSLNEEFLPSKGITKCDELLGRMVKEIRGNLCRQNTLVIMIIMMNLNQYELSKNLKSSYRDKSW